MIAYLMIYGLIDFVSIAARYDGRTVCRSEVIFPLMATLAAFMLQEFLWIFRSTYFLSPSDMEKL
jgi:hypothetical protein